MVTAWVLGKRRLDRVRTREASISRLISDVLAVLPKARPQRASRDGSRYASSILGSHSTRSERPRSNRDLPKDLAAAIRKAAGVHSPH
jgi:hypothetical protein